MPSAALAVGRNGEGMKIKYAVFDFDGTLFDSMFIWDTAGETYLRSQGKNPKPSMREDISTLSLYQSACYFQREYGLPFSADEIVAGINKTIAHFYAHEILPKSGVVDFLEQMKRAGISMCIATATDRCQIEAALNRCKMGHYFDAVFTCGEAGHGKDEPVIFRKAMAHFGADRSETVVFEDALHAVRTAKADGFLVAAVFDESEKQQKEIRRLSDCYISDFEHTETFWEFASAK